MLWVRCSCAAAHLAGEVVTLTSRGLACRAEAQCTVAVAARERLARRSFVSLTRIALCSSNCNLIGDLPSRLQGAQATQQAAACVSALTPPASHVTCCCYSCANVGRTGGSMHRLFISSRTFDAALCGCVPARDVCHDPCDKGAGTCGTEQSCFWCAPRSVRSRNSLVLAEPTSKGPWSYSSSVCGPP